MKNIKNWDEFVNESIEETYESIVSDTLNEFLKFKKKPEYVQRFPIEDFGGNEPKKIIPEEGYDLDRFYKTIEILRNKEQYDRKNKLTNIFFRNFIGKDLLDSTIKDFHADVITDHDYYGLNINLSDGSSIGYVFNLNGKDNVNFTMNHKNKNALNDGNYQSGRNIPVTRKDARLIGNIVKKFNPNTKYAKGTGDLKIKEY
jgi:hypothetical protein